MAVVAAVVAADLAAPDSHKRPRVAVGAAPGQDVAVGALHNGKDVAGALVGHGDSNWCWSGQLLYNIGIKGADLHLRLVAVWVEIEVEVEV